MKKLIMVFILIILFSFYVSKDIIITKDYIIVKARNYDSSNESKELTSSLLQKDAIHDYELLVEDKNVKITLPSYEKDTYVVVFNKSITKDNNFAYAYTSLVEESYSDQPYVKVVEDQYLCGEQNPTFTIEYKNITIIDDTKIDFSLAFADLSVMTYRVDEEYIHIISSCNYDSILFAGCYWRFCL